MTVRLILGDCRDVLKTLPDASVDSIVTDPPYELTTGKRGGTGAASMNVNSPAGRARIGTGGFMGQQWDATGIAHNVEMWSECLRVLKPGGHLLAFGGTRTYHRLACAIEDAGFEIRDQIGWAYGSGFPKSLDVSKAIDQRGGVSVMWFGKWLRQWRDQNGITQKQVAALFPSKTGGLTGCVANWELGLNMPTAEQFNLIRDTFGLPFDSIEAVEREVVAQQQAVKLAVAPGQGADRSSVVLDITAPATEAARQWQGWGTALKPAYEPVVMAQKPYTPQQFLAIMAPTIGELLCKVASLAETDTSSSELLRALGFWSTASSLNECLVGLSRTASRFTTETAFAMTTDLRTLKSSLSRLTQAITTGDTSPTSGAASSASDAAAISRSVQAKCERLSATTAGEIAIDWSADEGSGPEGSRLSPDWRSIVVARKPLIGNVAANVLTHGTGALNIDGCRIEGGARQLVERAKQYRPENFDLPSGSHTVGETTLGRWPANLIHDGSDEVLAVFPQAPGQLADASSSSSSRKTQNVYGAMKRGNGRGDEASADSDNNGSVGFKMKPGARRLDNGSAARFFYCAKASPSDRGPDNTHPTVKPTDLMRYLCRLVTPPGGTVLDPFAGSGSTLKAAELEGFDAIGIELSAEYIEIARRRIASDTPLFTQIEGAA